MIFIDFFDNIIDPNGARIEKLKLIKKCIIY
jgi:hypothetical protein